MNRDKAENLRDRWSELLGAGVFGLSPADVAAPPAEAEDSPASEPQIAIGVMGKEGTWRLAVRVQGYGPKTEEFIAAMRSDADEEVDVRHIGQVEALTGSPKERARPVVTGISCGHFQGEPGTIACFVRGRNDPASPRFILSNNHVIGLSNLAQRMDAILQPAFIDLPVPGSTVGHFERSIALASTHNRVDAAIARIDEQCTVREVFGRTVPIAGIRTTPLQEGESVTKVGRTTGETNGKIFAIGVNNLEVDFHGTTRFFDQQIEIAPSGDDPFCDGGDSGSLVLDANSLAVGLLFGKSNGDDRFAYANPIGEVFDRLLVDLE
jgi:hypothetical protein